MHFIHWVHCIHVFPKKIVVVNNKQQGNAEIEPDQDELLHADVIGDEDDQLLLMHIATSCDVRD